MGAGAIAMAFDPRQNRLNWLLLAIPVTLYAQLISNNPQLAFVFSMISIMPLAFILGHATEEIALRTSESVGGLLNATFGNAVEMIIAGLAIWTAYSNPEQAELMLTVVQASLVGSILGNLLLVMGLAMVWGGFKHHQQSFSEDANQMNGSLLLLAVLALIIPSAVGHTSSSSSVLDISRGAAIILLVIYLMFLLFQLRTHKEIFESAGSHHEEEPSMSSKDAWTLLIIATILVGWIAENLVHSIDATAEKWELPALFIGVILLPFFGNAAEHFTAVTVAGKDKMDLSLAIAIGSSVQIAVFVAPVMVLMAWILGVGLSLEFGLLETSATFCAVLVTNSILSDGKTNWLEGMMLLACYAVLGLAFYLM